MISAITGLIGGLLYPLFSIIFVIIDLLQGVFYGLAGIGDIGFNRREDGSMGSSSSWNDWFGNGQTIGSTNDGGETSTGLIYYLLTSDLITNLFISILVLALFLIIIFTAMAFIKNAYASKQKTWQEIVGNAFKGLANFIFIPVCCLLGIWLSNILLVAINGATSTGGATQMSRKLFICCAYDANEYRNTDEITDQDIEDIKYLVETCSDANVEFDENHSRTDFEYFATVVDSVYAQTSNFYANISWWGSVERFYSLFNFNYLVLIVGGVFMLYVLVSVAYAMVKRMFILLMLFVISPAICAMYPIDEGSAVGSWKKEFIKYTISAYGAIAGMNLFFSILPIVENISITRGMFLGGSPITDEIFQLLIMVSGLFVVKEFMGTLSNWIGGDNALTTGESLKKSATGAVKKYATGTVKATGGAFKAVGRASAAAQEAKSQGKSGFFAFNGSILGQATGGILKATDKAVFGGEAEKLFGNKAKGEKGAFGSGKSEKEKEIREGKFKEATKNDKADAKKDLQNGTLLSDAIADARSKEGLTNSTDILHESLRRVVDKLKDAGYDEQEALDMAGREIRKGHSVGDVQKEYKKATKDHGDREKQKDLEKAAAENAAAMRGQAESSAMFNNVEAANIQVKASKLEVEAQNSTMQGLAATTGANPALIAEMQSQVASGKFSVIPDSVLPTDSMTVEDIDLLSKWNDEMDKIEQVNDKYKQSLSKLQAVAESVASKLEGVDTELANFKTTVNDANSTMDDLDKSTDDLTKAMSQAVNENKKKGSGGTP